MNRFDNPILEITSENKLECLAKTSVENYINKFNTYKLDQAANE